MDRDAASVDRDSASVDRDAASVDRDAAFVDRDAECRLSEKCGGCRKGDASFHHISVLVVAMTMHIHEFGGQSF